MLKWVIKMIKTVDKEYVKDNLVQLMIGTNDNEIILDGENLLLLKVDNVIYVNKYLNHPKRALFPYQDIPMHKVDDVELYNVLFEVDKDYLIYEMNSYTDNIIMSRFAKIDSGALWREEASDDYDDMDFHTTTYTKEELARLFDPDNYDSLFVIDTHGRIVIASTQSDGKILNGEFLPTKEEEEKYKGNIVNICGGMYPTMKCITVKNGQFKAWAFSLTLDRDGTYVLDRYPIKLPNVRITHSMKKGDYQETNKVSL